MKRCTSQHTCQDIMLPCLGWNVLRHLIAVTYLRPTVYYSQSSGESRPLTVVGPHSLGLRETTRLWNIGRRFQFADSPESQKGLFGRNARFYRKSTTSSKADVWSYLACISLTFLVKVVSKAAFIGQPSLCRQILFILLYKSWRVERDAL